MKKIKCDVVVVGAGPGGSMAAKTCAKAGLNTVLVEREEYPARPHIVSCFVDRRIFEYLKMDKIWIYSKINCYKVSSPDGTEISTHDFDELGYAINRNTFDKEVLNLALKDGAEFMNKTRVTGLITEDGKIAGVKAKIDEKEEVEIRAPIVIGADGMESKIGRWARIYKDLGLMESMPLLSCVLDGVNLNDEQKTTVYHYLGWKNDPNTFHWIASHGNGLVSIDTVPLHTYSPKKGELFKSEEYFIKTHPLLSNAKMIGRGGGQGPGRPLEKITTDGVMIVGAAANQTDSIWGAGISRSMDAGVLAGETAVDAHEEGDFSSQSLSSYEKKYYRLHGEEDVFRYYTRRIGMLLSTDSINNMFRSLKEHDSLIDDELFNEVFTSKFLTQSIYNLKRDGLDKYDIVSFTSKFKRYFRSFWDTFVQ